MELFCELLLTAAVTLLAAFLLATLFAANDPPRRAADRAAAAIAEEAVEEERYALGGACRVLAGVPAPLGDGGVNFAVNSGGASAASLCLFTPGDLEAVSFPLRAE